MNAVLLANLAAFTGIVKADTALTALRTANNHAAIASYYNAVPATPTMIFRPSISVREMNTAIVGAEFVALTALKQNLLTLMLLDAVDATSPNVRANFTAIFGAGTTLTNLTAVAQRPATRLEALLVTNGVSQLFGYLLTPADVAQTLLNDDGSAK